MMMKKNTIRLILFLLMSTIWNYGYAKAIQTFSIEYGKLKDAKKLAKFDVLDVNRGSYKDLDKSGKTWARIKAYNPNIKIFLYQAGMGFFLNHDSYQPIALNSVSRYKNARGHSMGDIYHDNPNFILRDSNGNMYKNSFGVVMADFGDRGFADFWNEATDQDIIDRPWMADGIFVDLAFVAGKSQPFNYSVFPPAYPDVASWNDGMVAFNTRIVKYFNNFNQKLFANVGNMHNSAGANAWLRIDRSGNAPYLAMEEGWIAVEYGAGDVQFFNHALWKRSIDTVYNLKNIRPALYSHTKILTGGKGQSNWGETVNSWDVFYYALSSYLLARQEDNNAYFYFTSGSQNNKSISWYDEYDQLNKLGEPIGKYKTLTNNGITIYWRQYENGYVYVNPNPYYKKNPSKHNATSIKLPVAAKRITHSVVNKNWSQLPNTRVFNLPANRGAIFYVPNSTGTPSSSTPTSSKSKSTNIPLTSVSKSVTNCPCSIWGDSVRPKNPSESDVKAVELGLKFSASASGYIKGVRFYKGTGNTGKHIGNLWTITGQKLASATFKNESSSGWQEVYFNTPVAINANTAYIVSYHAPNGHYSNDNLSFNKSVVNGPLRALKNGEIGGNGVYRYSGSSSFPISAYRSTNYFVDVIFEED
jgi:Domain of unknown function (DUF4082)/Hypothetical glycosyl hydrolase family 15